MAIQFPCLQKDISFWFPQENLSSANRAKDENPSREFGALEQDLIQTLKKFLLTSDMEKSTSTVSSSSSSEVGPNTAAAPIVSQPLGNSSNLKDWLKNNNNNADDKSNNIMSPVLKETPRSHWLLKDTAVEIDNKIRVPDMSTSIWLASTSTEPLTCVTRSSSKARVEWPSILSQKDIWLLEKSGQKAANHLDAWLAKNLPKEEHRPFLDNWLAAHHEKDKVGAWLVNSRGSSEAGRGKGCESSSFVEKWLCLAAAEEEDGYDDMDVSQDDNSSIAVLGEHEVAEEEEDFDFVDGGERANGSGFWLL